MAAMGGCCYGSGLCVLDTQVHCGCVGGTYSGDNTVCEPNPCTQPSPIIYVDASATGTNSGASWTNAYTSLQSALSASSGGGNHQVWVAAGTYKPTTGTDRTATFQLLNNVALYGGFAGADSTLYQGGETALSQRDPSGNPTILSGDLYGNDDPNDPNFVNYGDNSYRVLDARASSSTDRTLILDGFTITGGNASASSGTNTCAGGLAIYQGGVIRNCIFVGNSAADSGGAVYCAGSPISFANCVFRHNRCRSLYSTEGTGGAIRMYGDRSSSALTVTNCTFVDNTAGGSATTSGGAIGSNTNTSGVNVSIGNSIFWSNTAGGTSSQIFSGSGIVTSVTYCDVQGGFTGTGNIDSSPSFVSQSTGNLHLASGSPCIDSGNNTADTDVATLGVQPIPATDLDLHARRMDDPNHQDASGQSCPVVDMGAYEFRRLCEPGQCARGDGNGDGNVDGLDIQPLVNCLIGSSPICDCPCYDMNLDGIVTVQSDVPCFVNVLLGASGCVVGCEQTGFLREQDCNENGTSDSVDITNGTSQDCNHNFIPDECDIANCGDPNDPNNLWCQDVDSNGIPDGCEPDCNHNGIPDAWDIATCDPNDPNQAWCHDINSNGVPDGCEPDCNHNNLPDSWEVAQAMVDDCNGNGVPDECERDCNDNGVPDDCDIADETSPDCNGNGIPDECDFTLPPPFGSLDCNNNGIPDECDIAACGDPNDPNNLWCQDCNGNGIPDGCDIASQLSLDENENGIPDECEEGQDGMFGGGEQDSCETTDGGDWEARGEAWADYFDWAFEQNWGPASGLSGAEQFQLMVDKLLELDLPVRNLTMPARSTEH
jgi:hypothetical protein